jgi:hypothetical protein
MSELENEIKAQLMDVFDVSINSKVVSPKDDTPKIVTIVKFEYEGQPSVMEQVLQLAVKGQPIFVKFYSPQLSMSIEEV